MWNRVSINHSTSFISNIEKRLHLQIGAGICCLLCFVHIFFLELMLESKDPYRRYQVVVIMLSCCDYTYIRFG